MNFSFLNNFGLGANPPEHSITDTTNYAGQGYNPVAISGLLKLTGPAGVYYINPGYINDNYGAPDTVDPFAAVVKSLPLNGDGEVEQGTYYVDYKIKVAAQQLYANIIGLSVPNNSITLPGNLVAAIQASPLFAITGSTGNDGLYNVTSASYVSGNTVVVLLQALPSPVPNGQFGYINDLYFQAPQQILIYTEDTPCALIDMDADCGCAKLTSRDATVYGVWSLVQRTHTLNYPLGSGVSPVVSSSALILINDLYTNTYVAQLSLDISYSPSTGFTITDTITAQKDLKVVCDAGLCCIYSCMKAVMLKYIDYKANGSQMEANRYQNIIIKMYGYWMMYSIAQGCGNENDMATHLGSIKTLIDTECGDCACTSDCNDGATTQVIPFCGPNGGSGNITIYDVVACVDNNYLIVTPNLVNDTLTFTVCVNETNLDIHIAGLIAAINLEDLADVTITTVIDGQALVWDSGTGQWVNQFIEYNDLNDVDVTTDPLQNGDMMIWDTVNQVWVNVRRDGILYNPETIVGTDATLNWKVLHTFPVPAGRLNADGDQLRWLSWVRMVPASFAAGNQRLRIKHTVGGVIIPWSLLTITGPETYLNQKKIVFYKVEFFITRVNNTEVSARAVFHAMSGLPLNGFSSGSSEVDGISITGLDLDGVGITLETQGKNEDNAAADTIKEIGFMVEKMAKI